MAKHPHKLLLVDRKTWKCVDCNFFVHLGLAHVLPGKAARCWNCEEEFTLDLNALKDEKPKCIDCRLALGHEELDITETEPAEGRTPEQQKAYEKEMAQMFGKDWRKVTGGQ